MFDEIQREAIRVEAEALLKRFSTKLAEVQFGDLIERPSNSGMRHSSKNTNNDEFREMLFLNAPMKEGDFIITERKSW